VALFWFAPLGRCSTISSRSAAIPPKLTCHR
jgi:hypothetical protein